MYFERARFCTGHVAVLHLAAALTDGDKGVRRYSQYERPFPQKRREALIHGCVIRMGMLLLVIHRPLPESSFLMLQEFLVPNRGWC